AKGTFLFAGANQSATSSVTSVTVYGLPTSNITFVGPKIEEDHNILVVETVINPSNVQIDNVSLSVIMPKGLTVVTGETASYNFGSIAANQSATHDFTVTTNQPIEYIIPPGNLTFYYQNHIVKGNSSQIIVSINDDITLRYGIPIIIGLIIVIGTILYVRRLAPKQ
ncbi:MAG TPA: hypothetical protein VED17_09365, partial [Nitrososphaerales archaeon]|nr:hypothetical protein [Nitrososphaerales archaeon]